MTASAPLRSLLFVPGDSEKKIAKVAASSADAVILDLEDAVTASRKKLARELVAEYIVAQLGDNPGPQVWVRINPLGDGNSLADLAAVVPAVPAGIVVPKVCGPADVLRLHHYLDALEVANGIPAGSIRVLPVATETAGAPFQLGDYAQHHLPRMYGLTWGAEDLSADLGATTNVDESGRWSHTYQLVRSMALMGARAAQVEAVETLYVDIADSAGLAQSSRRARAEGFSGRIAIHPAQVDVINEAFTPSDSEVEHARRVVAAFEADTELGTVALDGRMLDLPHLRQARTVLAQAAS